ncbi:hypothetical protein BJF78_14485 [Pseudonocardia sp. CNS-139]|nr:hypothetical protein BJF78_14485 [Pseudonocardia sp. CNS-139]
MAAVRNALCSDARNATRFATSSGRPGGPIIRLLRRAPPLSGSSWMCAVSALRMEPSTIALARTPCSA